MTWSNTNGKTFLTFSKAFIPEQQAVIEQFIQFIRHDKEDRFTFADVCAGDGWLTESLLTHYPNATAIALDRTEALQSVMKSSLDRLHQRITYRHFELMDDTWTQYLTPVDYVFSSLSFHHIDNDHKLKLFQQLYRSLQPDGGFMFFDIVAPTDEGERLQYADEWDAVVRAQSMQYFGNEEAYDYFANNEWNIYRDPETIDYPMTIATHLRLLNDVGFRTVMTTKMKAGHVLFSGFK